MQVRAVIEISGESRFENIKDRIWNRLIQTPFAYLDLPNILRNGSIWVFTEDNMMQIMYCRLSVFRFPNQSY